jgi:hypothetical protein
MARSARKTSLARSVRQTSSGGARAVSPAVRLGHPGLGSLELSRSRASWPSARQPRRLERHGLPLRGAPVGRCGLSRPVRLAPAQPAGSRLLPKPPGPDGPLGAKDQPGPLGATDKLRGSPSRLAGRSPRPSGPRLTRAFSLSGLVALRSPATPARAAWAPPSRSPSRPVRLAPAQPAGSRLSCKPPGPDGPLGATDQPPVRRRRGPRALAASHRVGQREPASPPAQRRVRKARRRRRDKT